MSKTQPKAKPQTFASILDKPATEIEPPKLMPVGTYVGVVQGLPRIDKSSKKQTEFVEFTIKYLQPTEDVDAEALAEAGGVAEKTIKATFYITENSAFMLKEFLKNLGLEPDEEGSLRACLDQTTGKQLLFSVKHEASEDGERVFARFGKSAPVA